MAILTTEPVIKIGEKTYKEYDFSNLSIVQELLKPNKFRFSMKKKTLDESDSITRFSICNELLGEKVVCKLNTHKTIGLTEKKGEYLEFSGIIVKAVNRRDTRGDGNVIEVVAYSPDYLLYNHPHCHSYEEKALADIVSGVIEVSIDTPKEINPQHTETIPYTVRYNENSYQFLARLAQRYGEWFYYDGTTLVFGKPKAQKDVELVYPNSDLFSYEYSVGLEHLDSSHAVHNYLEYKNETKNGIEFLDEELHHLTDSASKKSKELFKPATVQDMPYGSLETGHENALETSLKIQGIGQKAQLMICCGKSAYADLRLGTKITIQEKYKVENRTVKQDELIIYRIVHTFNINGDYENEFRAVPAKSDYPPYVNVNRYPVAETQRALVKNNQDPEKLGRIRVQFLWQEADNLLTPWIRMAQPHGGDNKGFYFIPEIDEEVMVGFEMGNAEKPYAIGTLYHGKQRPGENWYNASNDIKAIRTRNGHTVEIHDDGDGGFIRIYDNEKENYVLTFSTDEKLIKLQSKGNIELYAEKDIILDAKNDIHIKAGKDINRDAGDNVTETAGKNISTSAGEDISVSAGNDMNTSVGNNDTLNVGSNQTIEVGANKDETITEKYQLSAQNICEEASDKMLLYSQSHEQKADSSMKLDGGSGLDLYASNVKIN